MLLDFVVPKPASNDVWRNEVAYMTDSALIGGGQVGGEAEAEGEGVDAGAKAGTIKYLRKPFLWDLMAMIKDLVCQFYKYILFKIGSECLFELLSFEYMYSFWIFPTEQDMSR